MSIASEKGRRNLAEAHFTWHRADRHTGGSLCDCLIIDPCGCTVNPCTCFVTDAAGCYQDCSCELSRPLETIDIADRRRPAF